METSLVKISKFLSLVLRHKPEQIRITLESNGWVYVDDLLNASEENGFPISKEILNEVVVTSDKQRFSFSEDGTKIRANQGHSLEVVIEYSEAAPPEILFHGTVRNALAGIRTKGIIQMKRQYVHLSDTIDTAKTVGSRRGNPIVLTVNAAKMVSDGYKFYLSKNGVWLTKIVPYKYLDGNDI